MTSPSPTIRYRVAAPDPHSHYYHVSLEVDGCQGPVRLALPAWTPGSYCIRDYARHVESLQAEGEGGTRLAVAQLDKQTWEIEPPGGRLRATWRVYAHDLTVRTSHLDGTHGYFNGACLFPAVVGRESEPVELQLSPPADWRQVATALDPTPDPLVFRAADFDTLLDCPVEMGTHRTLELEVAGKPHTLAIWGEGNEDCEALAVDTADLIQAIADLFGEIPYERYVMIVHLTDSASGGLEHASSTTLSIPRFAFRPASQYRKRVLGLVAHEVFHAWNGKRLRPAELGPFDYSRENYTTLLWLVEGITSYYDSLLVRRAQKCTPDEYLEGLGERLTQLARQPGRQVASVEQASFEAWTKFYSRDENWPNRSVSYYLKGGLVAWLLDLDIRARTGGERSLDDAMRMLFRAHGRPGGGGVTSDQVRAVCEELAGGSLAVHFDTHLGQPGDLDPTPYLGPLGLRAEVSVEQPAGSQASAVAWMGAQVSAEGSALLVRWVPRDSPAARAGLYPGDEILALDGFRLQRPEDLEARLGEREPQDRVRLLCSRRGRVLDVLVDLQARPADRWAIRRDLAASPEARRLYAGWIGAPWPDEPGS